MAIQFPNNPGIGSVFTDTDAGFSYEWDGTVWKSFTPAAANNIKELDDISSGFDNSTTTFNLTILSEAYQPVNAAMLQISLGGVIQEPSTDYTVSFTDATITFTTAPAAGLDFFGVVRGTAVAIDYATDGNVQTKQEFTATEGQTSFTVSGGYSAGYIDVFRNGVRLGSDDFTDTSGTAIVLTVPAQADDLIETVKYNVASLVTTEGQFTNLNISGVATVGVLTGATSIQSGVFYGDGSGLTGVASTDNIQTATAAKFLSDVSISGVTTVGVVTGGTSVSASHFYGDGSGLTGVASTDNIQTATQATFLGDVSISGVSTFADAINFSSANTKINAGSGINVVFQQSASDKIHFELATQSIRPETANTGEIGNATYPFKKVTAQNLIATEGVNATGVVTAASGSFSGNVSVGGTLTYQDVTNIDSIGIITAQQGIQVLANGLNVTGFSTFNTGVSVTGVVTATSFSGDGSALTGISAGISTAERTGLGNTTIFLDLTNAQHHTITLAAGISTIDCTGGSVGDSHSVVLINPSSVGSGVTVGFATDFLFPSGSVPSLPTGADDISLISFVVKQTGAGGTEVLASAGLNYSN